MSGGVGANHARPGRSSPQGWRTAQRAYDAAQPQRVAQRAARERGRGDARRGALQRRVQRAAEAGGGSGGGLRGRRHAGGPARERASAEQGRLQEELVEGGGGEKVEQHQRRDAGHLRSACGVH